MIATITDKRFTKFEDYEFEIACKRRGYNGVYGFEHKILKPLLNEGEICLWCSTDNALKWVLNALKTHYNVDTCVTDDGYSQFTIKLADKTPRAFPNEDEDLALRLSPNITIQNGGLECIIEFGDRDFKFEFEQPISRVVQLANSEKGCHKKEKKYENNLLK